jgi:alpha-tubulin suppressor-like RCC1 family protein/subtilisin family serine protease
MQTILLRSKSLAVMAAGILVAAILLLMTASARGAVVPEEHAASAPNDGPLTNDPRAIPGMGLKDPGAVRGRQEFAPSEVIVKFKENVGPGERANVRSQVGLKKEKDLTLIKAEVDKVGGRSVEDAVRALERRPEVEYAQPNFTYYPAGYADEPRFGELWGLNNTGQNGGTPNVDINALEASAITNGDPNLVVAVIDDGVDFSHPDLAGKAWTNPGEVPNNNLDDDNNGYVDDVNGWDFYNRDKTVHDPGVDAHGTHVSGTIAASIDGQGVVGVAPNVKIMALKFLGPNGGYTSDAVLAIQYAKAEGAKISNNSWGGGPNDQALYDAINNSGSLFVAAAGNDGNNYPIYPAGYDLPNILSVAAVDNQGKLASFSNYGASTVDISAPGVGILSSVPGTPENSAATLSSVGSSGKALTAGFGADEIGDSAKRTSFFTKAFTALDRGSQQVVLVDDDADDVGFPDVEPSISSAIQGATGAAPQVIDVPYQSNGPALSQLSGKTVVWATGQAYLSNDNGYYITDTTLTSTDQATLTQFLNGGGKLIITGMNALYLIENSPFVSSTLNLDVASLVGGASFSGASGTAFAGESYTFNSPTAYAPYHAKVAPATSAAVLQGSYPEIPPRWESWSGTSMATPHATGAAALVASAEPALLGDPLSLKSRLMNGKPLPATAGKTVTGDMVDALKALKPPADSTAPTVSIVTPIGGANVDTTTNVVASFSEEMDAASVTDPANFTLRNGGCNTPATLSYDSHNKMATLVPSAPLDTATTYTVTVSGAWDLAGNQLDQDPNTAGDQPKTSSFTTAGSPPPNVWAWGRNLNGTLGDCTTTQRATPQQVGGLKNVTDVAAGCDHSLAVKDDGTVWAWGWNGHGQLGIGTSDLDAHASPVKVSGLSGVTDVAAGCSHSLALKDDGTVWAWGLGENGQLGDGTATKRTSPVKVSGLSGVAEVAAGSFHSLALKDDGTVWAWGYNNSGQLGDGTTTMRTSPVQVSGLSSVTDVAGGGHSLAIKDDGTVWAWGPNSAGQLGDGTQTDHTTPVQVSGLSGVTDVAAGSHSLAVKDDGTVWAWGPNFDYQLGVDTTPYWIRTTPAKVSGISNVVGVSGGADQSLAVKDDGTVWTWGSWHSGNDGGFDDCCTTFNKSPVQVGGLSGITYVVAGWRDSPYHNLAVSSDSPPPGDSQPPSAPTITSPQNNTYDTDGSFSVSGSAEAASTVELFEGTTSKGTTKADSSSGAWSIDLSGLSEGTHTYTAKATDGAGNTSSASDSVTVTVDKTAPTVSSTGPANNTSGLDATANVTATFSENVDPSTLTTGTFTLTKQGSSTPVAAHVTYDATNKKAILDPDSTLEVSTTYTATIKGGSTGVKDLAGNALAQDYTWTFTTATPQSTSCTITGTANAETISGTSADDVICAGEGSDTVKGLGGNDTLRGEDGNDTLLGGVGNDTLEGGTGTDTASYSASLTAVTASLATNSSTGEGSDAFLGVEDLLGSSNADSLTGSAANNKLTGGGGPDTEQGGSGSDQVIGSGGADTLKGEDGDDALNSKDGVKGNDSLDGGAGTDTKVTDSTEKSIVGFP